MLMKISCSTKNLMYKTKLSDKTLNKLEELKYKKKNVHSKV